MEAGVDDARFHGCLWDRPEHPVLGGRDPVYMAPVQARTQPPSRRVWQVTRGLAFGGCSLLSMRHRAEALSVAGVAASRMSLRLPSRE